MTEKEPPTETCFFKPTKLVSYFYLMTEIEPFSETCFLKQMQDNGKYPSISSLKLCKTSVKSNN